MDLPTLLLNPKSLILLFGGLISILADFPPNGENSSETLNLEGNHPYFPKSTSGPAARIEIHNWNFNDDSQGWNSPSSNNKQWELVPDGEIAFTERVCTFSIFGICWRYETREYPFHSPDNSQFFLINSSQGSGDFNNVELTKNFRTLGYTSIELSFDHHYRDGSNGGWSNNDKGFLEYRIGNEAWKPLATYGERRGDQDDFAREGPFLLEEAENSSEVQVRFRYDDAENDFYWAVDNIRITGVPVDDCTSPDVQITANFCARTGNRSGIELSTINQYASYTWYHNGTEMVDARDEQSILTELAGSYTVEVTTAEGCAGSTSIATANELIQNGNFENDFSPEEKYFYTEYHYWSEHPQYSSDGNKLGPEGSYAVDKNARDYHGNFYGPKDHTTGNGKYLMVNGARDSNRVIWRQTVEVVPRIDYYFSAWATNLHSSSPARLQFSVNGEPAGTIAELDANGVGVGEWIQFYTPGGEFWNSGTATEATIEIINLNPTASGNDFGIDDISFGNLSPIPIKVSPPKELNACAGNTLYLYANVETARDPLEFTWTNQAGEIISKEENPIIEDVDPSFSGVYTLSVRDFYGCDPVEETITVNVNSECESIDFDGIDDHVLIKDVDEFNFESSFTLEAWVKPYTTSGEMNVLTKADLSSPGKGYALIIENGVPVFRLNSTEVRSSHPIGDDRWYHLAAIYDGNNAFLYVDGMLLGMENLASPISISSPFLIGAAFDNSTPWKPKNNFSGWIQEVRLWNLGLSVEQLRFTMNQRIGEIETEGIKTNEVEGLEIRRASYPENIPYPLQLLKWENLKGYYPLVNEEVTNGVTPNNARDYGHGYLKNITTVQENSAPLPYYTSKAGRWTITTPGGPWRHPKVWDHPNSKGINGDPITWNIAKISHEVATNQNHTLLGLAIGPEGVLNIEGNNKVSGHGLTVTHYLELDGIIDLNGESQLIQTEQSILNGTGSGHIERDQQGTPSSYNYNYWSSPVLPSSGATDYSVAQVMFDGSQHGTGTYEEILFGDSHSFADGPKQTPIKVSNYWINAFYPLGNQENAGQYSAWRPKGSTGLIRSGEGYTMKGSWKISVENALQQNMSQNYTFVGFPNNGEITMREVSRNQNYLIGNPYPSALDADKFIQDNLAGENRSKNVFNGTLYFWSHFSGMTHNLGEYVGGYATYNLSGGVIAVANDKRIKTNGKKKGGEIPKRYIPVGQAFFINTSFDTISNWEGPYQQPETIHGGAILFKNSQRVFQIEDPRKSVFHRPEGSANKAETPEETRKRIWLEFISPKGYHRQLLVTADDNATQEFDLGYDGPLNDNVAEDMYWLIQNSKFVIQGVPHFNKDQELPLGLKIAKDSTFSISLGHLENIPDELSIYLRDSLQNTFHNLREKPFEARTDTGAVHNRFALVFRSSDDTHEDENQEGTEEGDENEDQEDRNEMEEGEEATPPDIHAFYSQTQKTLTIENPLLRKIYRVRLVNTAGQQVREYLHLPMKTKSEIPIGDFAKGVYIIKIDCGQEVTEKILIE